MQKYKNELLWKSAGPTSAPWESWDSSFHVYISIFVAIDKNVDLRLEIQ